MALTLTTLFATSEEARIFDPPKIVHNVSSILLSAEGDIYQMLSDMGHEQLVFCSDEKTGLKAIIGIHNTVLGPALGHRFWSYASEKMPLLMCCDFHVV